MTRQNFSPHFRAFSLTYLQGKPKLTDQTFGCGPPVHCRSPYLRRRCCWQRRRSRCHRYCLSIRLEAFVRTVHLSLCRCSHYMLFYYIKSIGPFVDGQSISQNGYRDRTGAISVFLSWIMKRRGKELIILCLH